jgi:hypothetical protein
MKSVCLILILGHQMVGIDKPFPSADACERGGFSMTDGQTVKGYSCLPRFMVDGLPTYDCGAYSEINLAPPAPSKCRFEIMTPAGKIRHVSAECDAEVPGAINILPPTSPTKKYQKPLE